VSDCCTPKSYRQIFSEKSAAGEAKRYRRKGLDGTSRRIFDVINERDVEGKTLLEVGGGIGAIEIELLKAGMARAINVELTPLMKPLPASCWSKQGWPIASSES
jgi:magnesium-protoporphyrin O-methyltransferase